MISKSIIEKEYSHYISLGYNCYVAHDLEQLGLRDASYPFDWLKSTWFSIEHFVANNFDEFLLYDNLYQHKDCLSAYCDKKYEMDYLHDFSKYIPLQRQLKDVKKKYNRRIERFYKSVSEASLFIRYIRTSDELTYMIDNYQKVVCMFRTFCAENDLVLICNDKLTTDDTCIPNLFIIHHPDEQLKTLNFEHPIMRSDKLYGILKNKNFPGKEDNLLFFQKKEELKNNPPERTKFENILYGIKRRYVKHFKSDYIHDKQI